MKNSNKRKLLLALVTALICVALATGGTLMLFTWRSGTATNTVTTGNVHFSFQESEDGGDTWLDVDDDAGLNINFSDGGNDFYPGDNVEKRAQIINNGEGNAYLKVEAKFTFATEADITTPPDWPDTADHQKIIMDALVKYWDTAGSRIYGPGFEVDTNSIVINNGEVSFTLYYVDNNNLLVFTPGTTAAVLDADIHLPTYAYLELATLSNTPPTVEFTDVPWGGDIVTLGYYEISDYLFDVQFGLELTVFAVQEKNNPYTSGYPWDVAFAGLSWTNQQ
jgi:hypothetical protein